jgi:hypothetical protein
MRKAFRFLKLRKNSSDIQDEYTYEGLSERIRGNIDPDGLEGLFRWIPKPFPFSPGRESGGVRLFTLRRRERNVEYRYTPRFGLRI